MKTIPINSFTATVELSLHELVILAEMGQHCADRMGDETRQVLSDTLTDNLGNIALVCEAKMNTTPNEYARLFGVQGNGEA